MRTKLHLMLCLLMTSYFYAQSGTTTTGGTATGTNGSASYSVGQVFYQTITSTGGTVTQGVQQPYEITTLGKDDFPAIMLQLKVFPNPTTSHITLSMGEVAFDTLSFRLFDLQGRTITTQPIANNETTVDMESLPSSIYFLNVMEGNQVKKSFKIVKK